MLSLFILLSTRHSSQPWQNSTFIQLFCAWVHAWLRYDWLGVVCSVCAWSMNMYVCEYPWVTSNYMHVTDVFVLWLWRRDLHSKGEKTSHSSHCCQSWAPNDILLELCTVDGKQGMETHCLPSAPTLLVTAYYLRSWLVLYKIVYFFLLQTIILSTFVILSRLLGLAKVAINNSKDRSAAHQQEGLSLTGCNFDQQRCAKQEEPHCWVN